MKYSRIAVIAGIALFIAGTASADLIVYPAKGQSQEQTEKDKFECYNWAKKDSGFDPMAAPRTQSAPPAREKQVAGAGGTALAGAAGGALVGALTGNTKRGALIGGGSGALIGGMRRNDQKQRETHAQQSWEQQETANYAQGRNNYNRAYSACLEGRGYSVK